MTNKKLTFSTQQNLLSGLWEGHCAEYPNVVYTTNVGGSRSAALHGIKRLINLKASSKVPSKKSSKKTKKIQETRVAFVIDRSGSMSHLMPAVKRAFESDVKIIADKSTETKQSTFITTAFFNDTVHVAQEHTVPSLINFGNVSAYGGTALLDAVSTAVDRLELAPIAPNTEVAYLVCILTDGYENASRFTSLSHFQNLIKDKQATDRWTFTMLVPPGNKASIARSLGIPEGNIREWETTEAGVRQYQAANASALNNYLLSRSAGVMRSSTYYADAGNITKAKANKVLTDINKQVKVFEVKQVGEIKPICEQELKCRYTQGYAFYQLTKPEKVQGHKKILIKHKQGAIYAGDDARQLLKLPMSGDARVAPGVNGDFTIFVQSTSTNRKLYPGSSVVYFTGNMPF